MWLLFLTSPLWADDMASERYCFSSPREQQIIAHKIQSILIPSDKATSDESCLVIQMRPHRRELIQQYIRGISPEVSIPFSSAEIKREACHLKVDKERLSNQDGLSVGVNQYPTLSQTETKAVGNDVMKIQTLKEFELSVNQDVIKGECRFINPQRYEIVLEVRKDPKPLVPAQLPPGVVVVINTPPPDQKTMMLKTQLQLNRGEKIEIGSLVQDLRDKSHQADLPVELKGATLNKTSSKKVFLSLE